MDPSPGMSFLESALADRDTTEPLAWLAERQAASHMTVRRVPFADMDQWHFDRDRDHLVHVSGRFYSVAGLRVRTTFGPVAEWDQPIILQPEIGILGILTRVIDGTRRFLMQSKIEPGNVNGVQLSPTVQATRSNYTRVHEGKLPPYVEYFARGSRGRVLVDLLQSEQGSRFLRKQNRNMVVEVDDDVPVLEDFTWMTLAQIKALMGLDDVVNMDARTVLACISYADDGLERYFAERSLHGEHVDFLGERIEGFQKDLLVSRLHRLGARHTLNEIMSWFADIRCAHDLFVEPIPLREVRRWERTDDEIRHETGRHFSVIGVAVEAGTREVKSWTQPLLGHRGVGLAGFLVQQIDGVLHFLVRACVEPGNFDLLDLGPTVACAGGAEDRGTPLPPFHDAFVSAPAERVHYDVVQSEEGGRFHHFRNRNMIVELPPDEELSAPPNYTWMTLGQIHELTRFGYFNIEARNLLACLGPA